MGSFRVTLKLEGKKEIDVLFSSAEFSRKTDAKGKPVTRVFGGRITIKVESVEDTTIIEAMLNNQFKPINGILIFKKFDEDSILKKFIFNNSYIVFYKEVFNPEKSKPMSIIVTFSSEQITIGEAFLDNQW
ncbi:type VI secretion system needle protein Hcp [Ornithobacterium rhinotracheale]|uniref:type VI secretion system tube protein TssD n=1 Tax=Ornithobacterium rhinotracheale TaxID=28251 RepID=UPI001FF61902|nr:type VI secretion system tube protein TssD [Ornithobacterium rhinotracheale]MCK0202189.1 type VI secretion system needle protein Hcp [Ornithobacterium rhinotracheale]